MRLNYSWLAGCAPYLNIVHETWHVTGRLFSGFERKINVPQRFLKKLLDQDSNLEPSS